MIEIPLDEIEWSYVRSSGPGGQNVNKVNSKAVLRWRPGQSRVLPVGVLGRFLEKYAPRLSSEGDIVLTSDEYRDQRRNAENCLQKLREMIALVWLPPKPRKKTKPSRGAQRRRVEGKRAHSDKKKSRGSNNWD